MADWLPDQASINQLNLELHIYQINISTLPFLITNFSLQIRQRPPLRHYTPLFSSLKCSLLPFLTAKLALDEEDQFQMSLFLPFPDPLQVRLFNLIPSVMELVHPHVYLWYKAEESGRLKMKTPTRELLCAHFVNAYVHCDVWLRWGNVHPFKI